MKLDKDFVKVYYNNIWIFIAWFFLVFTCLIGAFILVSFFLSQKEVLYLISGLVVTIIIEIFIIRFLYKIRVYQDATKIIVYGRRFEDVNFKKAFSEGLEITYDNIRSLDLIPIKYYNMTISYQMCIKTYKPDRTYYIYSFSNLDQIFVRIRSFKFRRPKNK